MTPKQLAAKYGIEGLAALRRAIKRADEAAAAAWEQGHYDHGADVLDRVANHVARARHTLYAEPYRDANAAAVSAAGIDGVDLENKLRETIIALRDAHSPRARGPKRKPVARAIAEVLADYWTRELGREFKQAWRGKDANGLPVPGTDAAGFCLDVTQMIDAEEVSGVPKAVAEVARTLRDNAKSAGNP